MKKISKSETLRYCVLIMCIFLSCRSSIFSSISPFDKAFCFAVIGCGVNEIVVAIPYAIFSVIYNFSFSGVIITLSGTLGMLIIYFLRKIYRRQVPIYLIGLILLF